MRAWLCIPSAREHGGTVQSWRDKGYGIAVWRDPGQKIPADICICQQYPGYSKSVNELVRMVLLRDPSAVCLVSGGDDTDPDPHSPDSIVDEFMAHFGGTFGVMQPTGDGHGIETICGSPWMGRDWCIRGYGGNGPMCDQYTHNFVDNDLLEVAKLLGILWQRPDLSHVHNNWMWTSMVRPAFLDEAYSREHWVKYQSIFENRKAARFPGHEPLRLAVSAHA